MNLRGRIEIAGHTHTGMHRDHNEDAIASDIEIGLAVLADGMGGLKAGEVASAMAVELITTQLRDVIGKLEVGQVDEETGYSQESLEVGNAVALANGAIHQVARTQPQCAGMGTTIVALLFYDNRMTVAHVGDSRLYRLRAGELEQVTNDHSLIQELIDRGFYTPEEARKSANRNVVTRALGIEPGVEYDLQEDFVQTGDVYLLCSDGLNDMVEEPRITELLVQHGTDLRQAAQALVDEANANGGKDNVSVLLVRAIKPFPARSNWFGRLISWFD